MVDIEVTARIAPENNEDRAKSIMGKLISLCMDNESPELHVSMQFELGGKLLNTKLDFTIDVLEVTNG